VASSICKSAQLADHFSKLAKIEVGKQKGPVAIAAGPFLILEVPINPTKSMTTMQVFSSQGPAISPLFCGMYLQYICFL
jgi:hypothetical protein